MVGAFTLGVMQRSDTPAGRLASNEDRTRYPDAAALATGV